MKARSIIIIALALATCAVAQYYSSEPETLPTVPKWLLMHRYWGSILKQSGDMANVQPGWVQLTETFDDDAALKQRLDDLVHHSGMRPSHFIGLWNLHESARKEVDFWTTEKLIPERIEQRKEIEGHWEIKP